MRASPIEVLYVHPHGHLLDETILPAGAITCMNAVSGARLGVLSCDLEDELVLAARTVAVDLFWASAYRPFRAIVERVRELRADVPIVVGGFTASRIPRALSRATGIRHVLTGPSCEESFRELVSPGQITGPAPRLDPVPGSWYAASPGASTKVFVHLARSCSNSMGPCVRCCARRSRGPRATQLLFDAAQLADIIHRAPGTVELWMSGLSVDAFRRTLEVLGRHTFDKSVDLVTCGALPEELPSFLDAHPSPEYSVVHLVPWHERDWTSMRGDERRRQLRILAELEERDERGVKLLRGNASGDTASGVVGEVVDLEHVMTALNWDVRLGESDSAAALREIDEFSRVVCSTLVARYFCPALFQHMQISADPQLRWPDPLPVPEWSRVESELRAGHARWGTILPADISHEVIMVRSASGTGAFDGSLRDFRTLIPIARCGADVLETHRGWGVVSTGALAGEPGPEGPLGVAIVPSGWAPLLACGAVSDVRVFPVQRPSLDAGFRVDIRGRHLRWSGSSEIWLPAIDGVGT